MLTIDIEGSQIPIAKAVVAQISLLPPEKKAAEKETTKKIQSQPTDTIFVKNSETDEEGKAKDDLIFAGEISNINNQSVIMKLSNGATKEISRTQVTRIIKHSTSNYEETIQRYAKPLFCPDDMFLVDIPPGKQGRPFFKVCVDRFEYPNQRDVIPQGNVSYQEAQELCKRKANACALRMSGNGPAVAWKDTHTPMDGIRMTINATQRCCCSRTVGSRHNCVSKYGGYDMVGNIFEWVTGTNNDPMLRGGP